MISTTLLENIELGDRTKSNLIKISITESKSSINKDTNISLCCWIRFSNNLRILTNQSHRLLILQCLLSTCKKNRSSWERRRTNVIVVAVFINSSNITRQIFNLRLNGGICCCSIPLTQNPTNAIFSGNNNRISSLKTCTRYLNTISFLRIWGRSISA